MVEGRAPVTIEKEGRGGEKERESSLLAVTRGGKRVVKCDGREKGEKKRTSMCAAAFSYAESRDRHLANALTSTQVFP